MSQADIKSQHGLPVFNLACEDMPEGRQVVLSFSATIDGERRDVALLHAPIELFGLPREDACELQGMPRGPFQLPDFLVPAIQSLISSSVPSDAAVWLEFTEPSGLLPIVPWETLFAPFGHRVLRLPQQSIIPQTPNDDFDAVICFSSPMAKELLPEQLVEMFIQQIPPDQSDDLLVRQVGPKHEDAAHGGDGRASLRNAQNSRSSSVTGTSSAALSCCEMFGEWFALSIQSPIAAICSALISSCKASNIAFRCCRFCRRRLTF